MSYERALRRLLELQRFGVRPGLDAIGAALERLGHPERAFPAIHIAGSNGKGSTAAMCDAVLRAAGLRVGLYTSPHLSRLTERVRVDGVEIAPDRVAALVERVLAMGPELTFFEAVTAMGFVAFAEDAIDVAVVEVGLGGRLDATNALARPLVSVVTGIALEHTEVLGSTLAQIAREKAGIFRAGVPAVAAARDEEARAAIAEVARRVGAPLAWLGTDFASDVAPALLGAHQRDNAALAMAALSRLPGALRPTASAREALERVTWPGRLERIGDDILLDGAHNADGARALAAALPEVAAGRPVTMVLGMVDDKDMAAFLAPLAGLVEHVVATTPDTPRARDAAMLAEGVAARGISVEIEPDPVRALERAAARAGLCVVAGSLFLIGQLRAHLRGEPRDPVLAQDPKTAAARG